MATGYGPLLRENQLVMSWSKQHNFPLSANMHGGALVANYPYDVCDAKVRRAAGLAADAPPDAGAPLPAAIVTGAASRA